MLRSFVIIVLFGFALTGCGSDDLVTRKGEMRDQDWEIIVSTEGISGSIAADLADQAEEILEKRFKSGSDKDEYPENAAGAASYDPELKGLFDAAETFRLQTDSAYDYRLEGLRKLWNLDGRKIKTPDPQKLESAVGNIALGIWTIDFGLLPAGWAVDGAAEALISGGVSRGKVSLGAVTRVWGGKQAEGVPWKVTLPPIPGDSIWKIISPPDGAVASYHPGLNGIEIDEIQQIGIVDPLTGLLSDSAIAVTAWANDAVAAAAYAQAFFVMGRRQAFNWIDRHQPVGVFMIYTDPVSSLTVFEADANLAECVSDSLPFER